MPGRKEQRGAAIAETREVLKNSELASFIFFRGEIICLFIFAFVFRETRSEERPKRPERRGSRGSLTGRANVANPKKPAKRKTIREAKNSFSLKIINNETKIRRKGIIVLIVVNREGRNRMKIGVIMRIIGIAIREP